MAETQPTSADPKPEPDLSGRRLGDYQLMRRLARGGMADVYLAEQQSLRRQVAFKVLRKSLAVDETYVRRFHNEAQAAAALVHASIVQIYEVGCIEGVHFIAQEYVQGQNLKQLVARRGSLKIQLAINVMRQVAAALYRASERGIIHRDIKPENIMLASTGEVKVADFGLARVRGEGGQLNLTQVGVTLGTPLYMSPEQVEGRTLDPRSDLYSFGVTCYEMLAGQPPFTGDTALSVAVQHLKKDPPRLEDLRPDLPGGLCRIVHKMLAKSPDQRFQNSAELLRDLRRLHVEGIGDDWPAEADEWSATELVAAANASTAATQQLATVMKNESVHLQRNRQVAWWSAAIMLAFLVGIGLAWAARPASLLEISEGEIPRVDRQETVVAQFWHAMDLGTEAAFAAVIEYFPPEKRQENEIYANKAKLHLAYLYRENDRQQEAIALLKELAVQEADMNVQANALIELANIHDMRGEKTQVQTWLYQLVQTLDGMDQLNGRQRFEWTQLLPNSLRPDFEQMLRERRQQPDNGEGGPPPAKSEADRS